MQDNPTLHSVSQVCNRHEAEDDAANLLVAADDAPIAGQSLPGPQSRMPHTGRGNSIIIGLLVGGGKETRL